MKRCKTLIQKIYGLCFLLGIHILCTGSATDSIETSLGLTSAGSPIIFFSGIEEKRARLAEFKKDKGLNSQKQRVSNLETRIQETKAIIDVLNTTIVEKNDTFSASKLSLYNDIYHTLITIQQLHERIESLIDQNSAVLEEYLKDSNLNEYKKRLNIIFRDRYTFDELQHINQLIIDLKKSIESLREQEKNIRTELKNYKHTSAATELEHKQIKDEKSVIGISKRETNTQKKQTLLALEEQLYTDKKERDALRLKEIDYKNSLIRDKIFVQEKHLSLLKDLFVQIKPAIKVHEADIVAAQAKLTKTREQTLAKKDIYQNEKTAISAVKKIKEQTLHMLSEQSTIPLGEQLDDLQIKPVKTPIGYNRFADIVQTNEEIKLLTIKQTLLDAQNTLEDELVNNESIHIQIMQTIYKLVTNKLVENDTKEETKRYETLNAETQAQISLCKEHLTSLQEQLKRNKSASRIIEELLTRIQEEKHTIFKDHAQDYTNATETLSNTITLIKHQIETLNILNGIYLDSIALLEKRDKQLDFVTSELQLITIWQRTEYAITWKGIENIIPNIQLFISDLHHNVAHFDSVTILAKVNRALTNPLEVLLLIFHIILYLFIIVIFRWSLLFLMYIFRAVGVEYRGLRSEVLLCILALEFVNNYLLLIVPWLTLFILGRWYFILEFQIYVLFYLLSIPYLMYVAHCFTLYLQAFNERHKYPFFSPEFQRRFILVISTALYSTIAILLVRKAYMLHFYFGSELPEILFLLWIVILQISLIFLLTKDHILGIIPSQGGLWNWIRRKVDQYYYIILIFFVTVIVMSNPFVGFSTLVIYILSRLIYTVLLLSGLYWCNIFLRRGLSHVFFTTEHEVVRERFGYGKSIYGFCVIAIFLTCIFVGSVLGAKIWSWPQVLASIGQWSDIVDWLKTPILLKESAQISVFSMLQVLFFIATGALIAFILNRFVLDKIFDILLVEPGVQNTISSLVRYAIFIIAVILGFQSIDLVAFVWGLIWALALGIGWVIKDPMGDFVAYFIILVQRPLKIGDYIQLDDEITGVVRKITARSIVLRRKNSTTIILPNSHIITKPVVNWNYLRGFIAFDDIIVTVGYKEDPAAVQKLFLAVLAENQYILKNPQPVVRLDNFSEYGFEFMVRGYISSNYTLDKWDIASTIRLAIAQRLRENNITIAVPARIIIHKDPMRPERQHAMQSPETEPLPGSHHE